MLSCAVLCCAVQCYAVLYYVMLYCVILCCVVLRCAALHAIESLTLLYSLPCYSIRWLYPFYPRTVPYHIFPLSSPSLPLFPLTSFHHPCLPLLLLFPFPSPSFSHCLFFVIRFFLFLSSPFPSLSPHNFFFLSPLLPVPLLPPNR